VNLLPGKDGLLHISQIAHERVEKVGDYLSEGQVVRVKVLETDDKGRVKLSMKALLDRPAGMPDEQPREPRGDRGGFRGDRPPRGEYRGDREPREPREHREARGDMQQQQPRDMQQPQHPQPLPPEQREQQAPREPLPQVDAADTPPQT